MPRKSNRRTDWGVGLQTVKRIKRDFSNSSFFGVVITSALEKTSSNENESNETNNPKFRKEAGRFCFYTATEMCLSTWASSVVRNDLENWTNVCRVSSLPIFLYQTTRSHIDTDILFTFFIVKTSNPTWTNGCFQTHCTPISEQLQYSYWSIVSAEREGQPRCF